MNELDKALLDVVLEHSNQGIHMVDNKGVTRYYNLTAASMDGLAAEDVLGKPVLEAFPSLSRDTSTLMKVIKTGKAIENKQQTYTNIRGAEITTINTTLPVFGQGGSLLGAVEVSRDITRIQQLAEQVIELRQKLHTPLQEKGNSQSAKYNFNDIVGKNPKLRDVLKHGIQAAMTDSPVLVLGETGTGKELLVQSIHNGGPRRDRPFVAQNCAALPEGLLEMILLGSVRGSFTGAYDRPGLLELANGGTLFLDELNSMPMSLQAKLLRILETGEVRRLGDTRVRPIRVRFIAAMAPGAVESIRPDLYYRLNVVNIALPPLRERPDDIPLLVRHFITNLNRKLGTRVTGIEPKALRAFQNWHWPGNVRELANILEGILNFRTNGEIGIEDLPQTLSKNSNGESSLRAKLELVEQGEIRRAMACSGGNISHAARTLGLPRQTLQRKLKKYGMNFAIE